jgi:heme-degrading monooxygenase HmoA
MSVTFINLFDVPAGRGEAFLAEWQKVNDYMRNQPGYQGHRLHRALAGGAKYQYVNVATWESAEAWQAAHDEGFFSLVKQPQWREFPSTPAIYEVVHAGEPAFQA